MPHYCTKKLGSETYSLFFNDSEAVFKKSLIKEELIESLGTSRYQKDCEIIPIFSFAFISFSRKPILIH